jgi:AcrR family transcriptional regulator
VAPASMLDAALTLLDAGGSGALTMRALGAVLEINPMTVHHHFGSRDGLIAALADRVYADVLPPACSSAQTRLEGLLRAYRAKVQRHPALTLEVFQSRTAFPAQARRISESLVSLLTELGLEPPRALLWRDILVDYLHGAALAESMLGPDEPPPSTAPKSIDPCFDPLSELIATLLVGEARRCT